MTQKEKSGLIERALELLGVNPERTLHSLDRLEGDNPNSLEEVIPLSLTDFKYQNLAVRIRSKILGEDIWLVSNENVREHLKAEGLVCYLPEEILHLKDLCPDDIRAIHNVKKVFDKSLIVGRLVPRDDSIKDK